MGESKPKFCKCGHNKEMHKDKKSKFSFATDCSVCPCSSYMNRKMPDKSSYFFMIVAISMGVLIIGISAVVLIEANPEITGMQDKPINMTIGQMYGIMKILFLAVAIFFLMWFIIDPILAVLHERKRRIFPIDEK